MPENNATDATFKPTLPRSTTTLFTAPVRAAAAAPTTAPKTFISTLHSGLKRVAVPVATAVGLRKKPEKSRLSRLMESVEPYEEIDEWVEIEEGEVREEMRAERERMRRGSAGEEADGGKGEMWKEGCGNDALVTSHRRRYKRWDDSEDEGEVIEIDGKPV